MPVGGALAGEACARSEDSNRALGIQFVLNCLGFPANMTGARGERRATGTTDVRTLSPEDSN